MASLQDLLAKRAALEQEIEVTQKRERQDAIGKVRALMSEYGLTAADLSSKGTGGKAGVAKGAKVPPKYRNASTGDTWSGRGLQPKWLKAALASGKKISDFVI
ncbi:MAG: H-NS histone family protein [Rhizobacter sp.]